jgi:hypothetical protein
MNDNGGEVQKVAWISSQQSGDCDCWPMPSIYRSCFTDRNDGCSVICDGSAVCLPAISQVRGNSGLVSYICIEKHTSYIDVM